MFGGSNPSFPTTYFVAHTRFIGVVRNRGIAMVNGSNSTSRCIVIEVPQDESVSIGCSAIMPVQCDVTAE